MSVEFLNRKDIKKSLSGQKKKKNRTKKKSILSLPEKLDVKNPELSTNSASTLTAILENLLPGAKLPPSPGTRCGENKSSAGSEEAATSSESKLKRNQLLLGINVVSKGVQNNTAACVITADDITPKLMISHLKLLCASKKVPFVSLPQLRVLTQKTLGFACIALGIKKSSVDFLPAVELILSTVTNEGDSKHTYSDDSVMEISQDDDEGKEEGKDEKKEGKKEEPFVYLYRDTRNGTRAFVPELHGAGVKSTNKNQDFIALGVDSEKSDNAVGAGAVENVPREQNTDGRKRKRKINSGPGSGTDSRIEYSMAKVMKLESNPVRKSEKYKKLKKL